LPAVRAVLLVVAVGFAVGLVGFNALTFAVAFARGPRPRGLARAVVMELLAGLALLPLWPLWMLIGASYQAIEAGGTGERRPVVLLHGYAMNRTNWVWLGRRLARAGVGPLYGASYFSPAPVAESARRLSAFVEEVRARTGARQVDIVAHSLGGLVARYYLERMGGAQAVARLVTIGTPHAGTRWGRAGWGRAARELTPGSPFLLELGRPSEPVRYTSIWSRSDNLVAPPESARLAPLGDDVVFDDLGHLSLLVSPRVADQVAARLRA
jgi:hypothetical protein